MHEETITPASTRSTAEIVSLLAAAVNLGWFGTNVFGWFVGIYAELFMILWLFAAPVLALIGVVAGVIAAYRYRSYLGLLLNIVPLILAILALLYMLLPSDGVPPQYR